MIEETRRDIPADHPIRRLFRDLTERGMSAHNFRDADTIQYLTDLLTQFVQIENMYRVKDESGRRLQYLVDLLEQASQEMSPAIRRDYYKHLGDLTLFNLGLFPESLTYGRRTVSPDFYAEQGRRSYNMVAAMQPAAGSMAGSPVVYQKLSEHFEQCVVSLNWVKLYINDPFYQYMFRQFEIT